MQKTFKRSLLCRPCLGFSFFVASATIALLLFAAPPAKAQNAQFLFDPSGDLLIEAAETIRLPQIIGQPRMQIIIPGESTSFSVGVADTQGVIYQWLFNGSPISGAAADSLVLTNVSTNNEGQYSVIVSNSSGSVLSNPAHLYIDSNGNGLPDSWETTYFGNLNQTATGDNDGDGVDNLQEFLDGTNPTNAASALYRVNVSNDGGMVIFNPSQSAYNIGQTVTLTAVGSNATPFHAWTGDVTSRSNSITLAMTTNFTLFAHFQPFTMTWTNFANGDWNVASNWTPNLAPGSNESVVIGNGFVVTENSNVDLVNFTLGSSTYGCELTGGGRVTIAGTGTWYSGTMSGSGSTVVLPGADFTFLNSIILYLNNRTFENAGEAFWMGGGNFNINSAVITNDIGAQFTLENPVAFNFQGGAPRFDSAGIFLPSATGTTTFNGISVNNYGIINLTGGSGLYLNGGGNNNGSITVPAGATLNLSGVGVNGSAGSAISGAGTLIVSGGSATVAGKVNVTGTNSFSGGFVDFTGNYTCVGNTLLDVSGGSVSFDGSGIVAPNNINLNGTLGGANIVTVSNTMNWSGGTMNGSGKTIIGPHATLNIAAFAGYGGVYLTDRTLENSGTVVWGGGNFGCNGVITNDAGATFQILGNAAFNFQGGAPRFDSAGIFLPSATGTTTFNGISVNNYGIINLTGGSGLYLNGGGNNNGSITVPAGATLNLSGVGVNGSAGSAISGAGTLIVSGGSATVAGKVNVTGTNSFSGGFVDFTGNYTCVGNTLLDVSGGSVSFDGSGIVAPNNINLNGTLGGANIVTVSNTMNWSGGTMNGSGKTIIGPHATLNIAAFAGYGGVYLTDRTLENSGTVVWGGGNFGCNGVITNDAGATFQILGNAAFNFQGGAPRFDNNGTLNSAVSGVTAFNGVALNNYNTIGIQRGILYANGGYVCSTNSILNCAIFGTVPGAKFGQLQVSGAANLKGSLKVYLTNYYVPKTNDSFTVLTASSVSGVFASFTYPTNGVTMTLSNAPASEIVQVTGVSLKQTNSVPAPPGMISWWRGENNATDSVGTNNGAITNGVTFAVGEVGQSFLFDGSSGYVSIPDSASLRPNSVTVEAWVKIFSTNGIQLVFAKPLGTATLDSYGLAIQNGLPLAAICDTNGFGVFLSDTNVLTLGQWHHMAFTFDATTGWQALYTDGAMVASGSAGKSMQFDSHPLLLGADIENTVPSYFLNGQVDEATIYSRALGSEEIASIYNVGSLGKQNVSPTLPILHMDVITPTTARIYWSTNYASYQLQYTTRLGTTNWAASGLAPMVSGTNFVVTNVLAGAQKYYRLSLQPAIFQPAPPALGITLIAPGVAQLSWSAVDDRPFVLQSNTNLMSSNWVSAATAPSQVGWNYVVTNQIAGNQMFFRLSSH